MVLALGIGNLVESFHHADIGLGIAINEGAFGLHEQTMPRFRETTANLRQSHPLLI